VLICPSNANHTVESIRNSKGEPIGHLVCASDSVLNGEAVPGERVTSQEKGMPVIRDNYIYLGYVLDRVEETHPQMKVFEIGGFGISQEEAPRQLAGLISIGIRRLMRPPIAIGSDRESPYNDMVFEPPYSQYAGDGNGGSDVIYRLREGIERFLITDIYNPGASAQARSEIFVMSDKVSTFPDGFNHIPGGANVLYMDGHVDFVRYPQAAPASRGFATMYGVLALER
jgi:prepilin-type processing-associated H-X9-DG protein